MLCTISVQTGWILGRTRHPHGCKPDGSRLGCYCPCSNKNYGQGSLDHDGDIDKLMQTRADYKHTKKKQHWCVKSGWSRFKNLGESHTCFGLRSSCVKKVLSNFINLLYPDKEWCLTLGIGSLWWESEEDLLTQLYPELWQERVVWQPGCFCSGI